MGTLQASGLDPTSQCRPAEEGFEALQIEDMVIYGDFIGFYSDFIVILMGFYSDLMGFCGDLMGYEWNIRSGNLTWLLNIAIEIVDFP